MSNTDTKPRIGISGLAAYVPPYRVWLEDWCDWTGQQWPKIRDVVGRSFRVRGPEHSVYTMAATAVMRLIDQYDIDPTRVKFLGLGTESSADNSAGAIIIKGMIDRALEELARGGMGRVYRARMEVGAELSKQVALKVVRDALADDSQYAEMIIAEANAKNLDLAASGVAFWGLFSIFPGVAGLVGEPGGGQPAACRPGSDQRELPADRCGLPAYR